MNDLVSVEPLASVIVALKVTIVILVIFFGWAYIKPENHTPFMPANTGEFGHFGFSGVMRAAGIVFFAYIGFDAVSTAAQEARKPQRDMPIGIIGSLGICTLLYVLFAWVLTGIMNYKDMTPTAIYDALNGIGFGWLSTAIIFGILAGYTSVILVMLLGQSRVFYSMSRDGLLPLAIFVVTLFVMHSLSAKVGFLASVWAVSAVVGPLAGGLIIQNMSWAWIFWVNVPIGLAAAAGFVLFLHDERGLSVGLAAACLATIQLLGAATSLNRICAAPVAGSTASMSSRVCARFSRCTYRVLPSGAQSTRAR